MDNPQGLQPRYHGPYPITKRTGETTIEVRTGTFKNGKPRLELHSWNNAKPAYLSETTVIAERPKLGRPVNPPSTIDRSAPPPSPPVPHQLTPKSSDNVESSSVNQPVKPVKQVKPAAPSTHNMTLRQR